MTDYKNENLEELCVPQNFYCTFHTEYAYRKAIEINTFQFMGEEIKVTQGTEPTDIIWENTHYRHDKLRCRIFLIVLAMAIIATGTFSIITWLLKRKLLIEYMKKPPGIPCDTYFDSFKRN